MGKIFVGKYERNRALEISRCKWDRNITRNGLSGRIWSGSISPRTGNCPQALGKNVNNIRVLENTGNCLVCEQLSASHNGLGTMDLTK
jgi:hypothetical protein